MRREKGKRRLGNPVFKMAYQLMAEDSEISNLENRPFHRAYLVEKFTLSSCCPHLGGAFCEETVLVQHYRAKHAADRFDMIFIR